jgi:hypothetical protein
MKWSEVNEIFGCFQDNLSRVEQLIATARRNRQQIYHANYKPWYVKRAKVIQSKFLMLKRRLSESKSASGILRNLESSLKTLVPPETDILRKSEAVTQAKLLSETLRKEIQREQEEEFDILPRNPTKPDPKLCFVMMPFEPKREFTRVYRAIRQAVRKSGLNCVRSDNIFDTRAVILDIWDNIRKSRICIADISNKNLNVFYELGMAHSIPKRVMLISKPLEKSEKPAFDTNYARCTYYRNTGLGLKILQESISRTLSTVLK